MLATQAVCRLFKAHNLSCWKYSSTRKLDEQNSVFLQVFELRGNELHKSQEIEKPSRFKCGTFGASSLSETQLATGSFQGQLQVNSLLCLAWNTLLS